MIGYRYLQSNLWRLYIDLKCNSYLDGIMFGFCCCCDPTNIDCCCGLKFEPEECQFPAKYWGDCCCCCCCCWGDAWAPGNGPLTPWKFCWPCWGPPWPGPALGKPWAAAGENWPNGCWFGAPPANWFPPYMPCWPPWFWNGPGPDIVNHSLSKSTLSQRESKKNPKIARRPLSHNRHYEKSLTKWLTPTIVWTHVNSDFYSLPNNTKLKSCK